MPTITSVLEAMMVCSFGVSWPLNVAKAWKSRTTKGISLPFYLLIWSGYVFGVIGKCVAIHYCIHVAGTASHWTEVVKWYVLFFYIFNLVMVSIGIAVYFRNRHLDKMTKG